MFRSERHTEYLDIPIWNMLVLKFVYDLRVGKKSEVVLLISRTTFMSYRIFTMTIYLFILMVQKTIIK